MKRFALALADWADRLARRVYGDPTADMLANVWEVDRGALILPITEEQARRHAMNRHPAGKHH